MKSIVQDFVNASGNAIEAGFDGVEIHGANDYLIEQFINGGINDRDDQYGWRTTEGHLSLVLEIVDAVVGKIGSERVGIRISPFNRIFDMPAFDGEEETWLELALELSKTNLAYVHISNRDALVAYDDGVSFLKRFREIYGGTLILAGQYTKEDGEKDVC